MIRWIAIKFFLKGKDWSGRAHAKRQPLESHASASAGLRHAVMYGGNDRILGRAMPADMI